MITFGAETLYEVIDEVPPLLEAHYRELAKNQDRVHLNPDWPRYAELERIGAFFLYTVRSAESELIGYSAFFASTHPHYADYMLVSNDVLWLAPSHRTGRTGVRFTRYCEEQIRLRYSARISLTWHAKEGTALASMLPRMGYGLQDIVFSKLL